MLIFENNISTNGAAFVAKVKQVADKLDVNPNWLMAVMYTESKLNPRALNPSSGAVGLIQWLPSTLQGYGLTPSQMRSMSNVRQLDYVLKYYMPYRHYITSYGDAYIAVLYPAALGKPDDYALPSSTYAGNSGVDMDGDGQITVRDIKRFAMKSIPESWKKDFEEKRSVFEKYLKRNWFGITVMSLLIMSLTYWALTRSEK